MQKLLIAGLLLAATVIALGAYTRLTDAGLGCPDWPGCYGQLLVPQGAEQIAEATKAFPHTPVVAHKAWNEMIHRYCASLLGLLILVMTVVAWRRPGFERLRPLLSLLLALVIFQGILGMWTVTLKLLPIVVSTHLLGGFTTFSLLLLAYLQWRQPDVQPINRHGGRLVSLAALALLVVVMQIALGGWTSANYAALVCHQLPACQGDWISQLDVAGAFEIHGPTEAGYEFGVLDYGARMTIHMSHRLGAVLAALATGVLIWQLVRHGGGNRYRQLAMLLATLLVLQLSLGLANILLHLPLAIAVAHNGVAALLLLALVTTTYHLCRARQAAGHSPVRLARVASH